MTILKVNCRILINGITDMYKFQENKHGRDSCISVAEYEKKFKEACSKARKKRKSIKK